MEEVKEKTTEGRPKKPQFPIEKPIFQRIYKKKKSRNGKTVLAKKKIGFLVAGVVDNSLVIGFSLCHRKDVYNIVDGVRKPHWARSLAISRALKWKEDETIEIPPSIVPDAKKFLVRCMKYYKDKSLPRVITQEQDRKSQEK